MKHLLAGLVASFAVLGIIPSSHAAPARDDGQPLSRALLPKYGTYWILTDDGRLMPPLPCPPEDPNLSVFHLEKDVFMAVPAESASPQAFVTSVASLLLSESNSLSSRSAIRFDDYSEIPNHQKFMAQEFVLLNTNTLATNNPVLYDICVGFPALDTTNSTLQVARYGTNALVFKASHFDYSSEEKRDFALIVGDKVETPIWRSVDLLNSTHADGWLVQGLVARQNVSNPMFMLVTNISTIYNAFFRCVPYGGPTVQLTGAEPYSTTSGTLALHVSVSDLSGATNQMLALNVDGSEARYSLSASNTVLIETPYTPNGIGTIYVSVGNDNALIHQGPYGAMDNKIFHVGTDSLPVDFQNETFVYFAGNYADPDILTNYMVFGVAPPKYIHATISEPVSGRVLKSFAGYNEANQFVQLDWNFTESDGATPYNLDDYVVSFTASASPLDSSQLSIRSSGDEESLILTNKIERSGVRKATGAIFTYEEMQIDDFDFHTGLSFGLADSLYKNVYLWYGVTQYTPFQIGSNRSRPDAPGMPLALTKYDQESWPSLVEQTLTNWLYSDFCYFGHANGYAIGGGDYDYAFLNPINTKISSMQVNSWVLQGRSPENSRWWRMRKVEMWGCYTAWRELAAESGMPGWPEAFGILPSVKQARGLMRKNVGLFFGNKLASAPYGVDLGDPVYIGEVILQLNNAWVCGPDPYPGGCDPTYSYRWAYASAELTYPELKVAEPLLEGFIFLPYSGVHDEKIMNLDLSGTHP